jgi:crossover junction endodeoxyribonuclease RuvC
MKSLLIGIDPGLTGAVATIDLGGNLISVQDTPTITVKRGNKNRNVYLETAMVTLLENSKNAGKVVCVGIENVHSMPAQGVSSSFHFGQGFGIWLGILAALRLPIQRIEPAKWKRGMGIASGAGKGESILKALQIFPTASLARKRDEGRAESLLLAEYIRRLKRF